MFEKILVPLDGSPLAQGILPYVMLLARGFQSRVILFHAAEALLDQESPEQEPYADEAMERIRPLAENYLEGVAAELRREGLDVDTQVVKGKATREVMRFAEQEDVDLIAMSIHSRSGLTRWVVGSVVDRLLRASHRSLLLVRPPDEIAGGEATARLSKIVVPLDGSPPAEWALPFAEELGKVLNLEVTLIQVIGIETTVQFSPMAPVTWAVPADVLQRLDVVASGYLKGLARELERKGLSVQWEVLRGPPGPRIIEFARQTPDCLVAMTSHGRSGFRRWILGSVANEVVRHTGEPVLIIRSRPRQ